MSRIEEKKKEIQLQAKAIRHAFTQVFGERSSKVWELDRILSQMDEQCQQLADTGGFSLPTIAIVGGNKVGKSWLARLFLEKEEHRQLIRSGDDDQSVTRQLQVFGIKAPPACTQQTENGPNNSGVRFIRTNTQDMLSLGEPYVLIDSPGSTDLDPDLKALALKVQHSATLKLLVVEYSRLRGRDVLRDIELGKGSTILPVIQFQGNEGEDRYKEAEEHLQQWRAENPESKIVAPIWMPKQGSIYLEKEAENPESYTAQQLRSRLPELLANPQDAVESIEKQMDAKLQSFKYELIQTLQDFRKRVKAPHDALRDKLSALPAQLIPGILGENNILRVGLRSRFRADWMERIPGICFPFKSISGLLAMTSGAWDKLIFASIGSLPSLALSIFQIGKNYKEGKDYAKTQENRLKDNLEGKIRESLHQQVSEFTAAVRASLPRKEGTNIEDKAPGITLNGLSRLEEIAEEILSEVIRKTRANGVQLLALIGALTFWGFAIGPLYSVYNSYIKAWWITFLNRSADWELFPTPEFTLVSTTFFLSILPVFILSMFGMSLATQGARIQKTANLIREKFDARVRELFDSGELSIRIEDERIQAARVLLELDEEH